MLLQIFLVLIVAGVFLWLINYVPYIHAQVKQIITVLVVVLLVLGLLRLFINLGSIRFGR